MSNVYEGQGGWPLWAAAAAAGVEGRFGWAAGCRSLQELPCCAVRLPSMEVVGELSLAVAP